MQIEGLSPPAEAKSIPSQVPEEDTVLSEETEDHSEVLALLFLLFNCLTLYHPMVHMRHGCAQFFHKPIRIYMGVLILGVNTLYMIFCFFRPLCHRQLWLVKG